MIRTVDCPTDVASAAPFRLVRTLARLTGATVAIAVLTTFAQAPKVPDRLARGGGGGLSDAVPVAGFVPSVSVVARPAIPVLASSGPRFRLDAVDPVDPVRAESPRLNPATGRREDTLSQGDFGAIEAPYLRMTIAEGPDAGPARSLFVTLARRGADGLGLSILRTGERGRLETKFGAVDTLEVTLAGPSTRTCTGFTTSDGSSVRLDGWLCAPLGQPPEPRSVACTLDKLVLNGQASSDFESLIRAAETRRDRGCASAATARSGEVAGQTGSIGRRPGRKNKAELRRSAQAQP